MVTVLIFLLVLSVLVLAHEFGHFIAARWAKIHIEEFGLGFPPRAKKLWTDKHHTLFSLNWLPLGGFVKLREENPDDPKDKHTFTNRPLYQKMVVILAGIIFNIFLAWGLLSVGYMVGLPSLTETADNSGQLMEIRISAVQKNSPAEVAGLLSGDQIIDINNKNVISINGLISEVKNSSGTIHLDVRRDATDLAFDIRPDESGGSRIMGVNLYSTALVRYGFFRAIWEGAKSTWESSTYIFGALKNLLVKIFSGQGVGGDVAGPVGIAVLSGQAASLGLGYLLQFMALLSLNLAFINILPLPALDGGRFIILLAELVRRKPMPLEKESIIHKWGMVALLILVAVIVFNDLRNFWPAFNNLIGKVF